jgi:hypothetical protein
MFTKKTAKVAGSKGGRVQSSAKVIAARRNGKQGGRPPSRTLAERLLGRKIKSEHAIYIESAYQELPFDERRRLERHFNADAGFETPLASTLWRSTGRRLPESVKYIVDKFRLAANHRLKNVPTPKDYVVEYRNPSFEEEEAYRMTHEGKSCPPRPYKTYIRYLHCFDYFEQKYVRGDDINVEFIMDFGGGAWTEKRAQAALALIKATHPRAASC